ncbi:acyl transferase/acyl hydrolase/lysophospholipase [Catenaria anguillulae PL171]|uniref:Lysophospholipase n=1 Tax=Catenaria anguillulae PL171 TaxID=765915 RepID=A0A1Y2I264_9FUNG|nr:acyl transferase/acyl hydrolase/lysophospholipase [Catenaria anguillulae PL171]
MRALDILEHVLTQAKSVYSSKLPQSPESPASPIDPRLILDPIRQLIQQPLSQAITPAPAHKLTVTKILPGQQCTLPAIQPDVLPHLCLSEMLVFSDREPAAITESGVGQVSIEFVDELVIQRDERGRLEALTPVDVTLRGWVDELVSAVGKRILSPATLDQVKQGMQDRQRFPELEKRVQAWESQRASMEEASHVHARRNGVVKKAFGELVGTDVDEKDVPVVAVAMSGGGYRAMLAAAGFLQGLSDTGLLPLTTYMSALSGSTYTLTQWLLTSAVSPSHMIDVMIPRLQLDLQDLLVTADTLTLVKTLTPLIQKQLLHQPMSLADFFGCLVAAQLVHPLTSSKHYPTMSDLAAHVDPQVHPWPMFTGVSHDVVSDRYAWVEFDPVNANCMWFDVARPETVARVPLVGVGREFVDRVSVNSFPEIPLSSLLGLWGSAFSGTVAQGWAELKSTLFPTLPATLPPDAVIHRLDAYLSENRALATDHPIPPTFIPNPWYDPWRAVATSSNLLASQPALSLMDAGLVCNVPVPTLLHPSRARKVDVVLVLDASSDIGQPGGVPHMDTVRKFAREWGIEGIERVGNEQAWKQVLRAGSNDGGKCDQLVYVIPGSPTLVYVPLLPEDGVDDVDVNRESWCRTGNFVYTQEQARRLVDMVRSKVVRGKEEIVRAILDSKCGRSRSGSDE